MFLTNSFAHVVFTERQRSRRRERESAGKQRSTTHKSKFLPASFTVQSSSTSSSSLNCILRDQAHHLGPAAKGLRQREVSESGLAASANLSGGKTLLGVAGALAWLVQPSTGTAQFTILSLQSFPLRVIFFSTSHRHSIRLVQFLQEREHRRRDSPGW